jgi:LPXTG-site transpeptidase (sortase) family protein
VQPPPSVAVRRPPTVRNGERLGRLVIPRLGVSAIVREGVGEDTLGVALGHIPGTALPGVDGNVGVAGHRDTLFRSLRKIRRDDVIEFETLNGTFRYQVEGTRIVTPKDVDVLAASSRPEMTLVTCYPFYYVGPAPDRFVVKARALGGEASSRAPAILRASVASTRPVAARPKTTADQPRGFDRRERTISFDVAPGHSRQLARGISFGLSSTDPATHRLYGWMWLMPDRRTIWLRGQNAWSPVIFFGGMDGKERKLVITNVSARSVRGYLVLPAGAAL